MDKMTLNIYQSFSSNKTITEVMLVNQESDLETSDIIDFVLVLMEAGFVRAIDGIIVSESLEDNRVKEKPNKILQFLFSKFAWFCYFSSALINLFLFFSYSDLRPKGSDFFVSESGIFSIFLIIISTWIVIFFHEYGHICAAKSAGIGAEIKWGYRLVFLVLETEVADIWGVPRVKRYGIYLAGLAWTSILILLCLSMQFYFSDEMFLNILKFAVLMQLQTVVFQTLLFLRTDLYYVLTNFLRVDDLNESMQFIFKNILVMKFSEINKKIKNISNNEKKIVLTYSILSFFGIIISLYLFFVIDVPIALYSVKQTLDKTLNDPLFSMAYWDGIAMGTLILCPIVILFVYLIFDFKKKRTIRH